MPDKTYAKFILNNETYLDLTGDTVDSSSLLSGYTAHNRSGESITGSFDTSIFVLKAGDTMSGSLTIANIEAEQLFEINSKSGLRLALDMSSLCNHGIWSSGYANTLTSAGGYTESPSWIIVRDSSGNVRIPKWASLGSNTTPVYFDSNGQAQQSTYSFSNYLPKTGGTVTFLNVSETGAAKGNSFNSQFTLGNSTDYTTTKGSCYGEIKLYSKRSGYALLNYSADATTNVTLTLPNTSGTIALTSNLSSYVAKSGSTMTGALTLSGAPTEDLHASTKKYVDDSVANYLPLTGSIMGKTVEDPNDDTHANVYTNSIYPDYIAMVNTEYYSSSISGFTTAAITSEGIGFSKLYTENSTSYTTNSALTDRELSFTGGVSGGSKTTYASYKNNGISYTTYDYTFPSASGTLALTSDLNSYVLKAGDSLTGALSFYDGSTLKSKISNTELQIDGHDLLRMTPHFAQMFATAIPANANLNTTTYLKVGQYYVGSYATATSISNTPQADVFTMTVESLISSAYDDESTTSYGRYRMRTLKYTNGNIWVQVCSAAIGSSTWTYGTWQRYITGYTAGNLQVNTSGASLDEAYCKQYGKTVNVRAWITGLSTSTQTHTNVITVQLVDMPTTAVRFVFTCWLGNGIAAYAGYGVMDTSGKITLVKAVANSDKASFEFTYNV